ncbi:MAG TPA: ubiquinone/menaquinone biosynthesis methyltransferase [Chthoniobacteraceae bacterium]
MTVVSHRPAAIQSLFSSIAHRYDLANHLLSGGFDFYWRRRVASLVAAWKPSRILDLATGSGDLALSLRAKCRTSVILAADFCLPMLLIAQRKHIGNLLAADGLRLPFDEQTFDVVTVAFGLRNMEFWDNSLAETCRVLRPGGHLLILDFSLPPAPLRWIYRPYLHYVLPFIAGFLTGERAAYDYLGGSIEQFPTGDQMCRLVESQGFQEARCIPLSGGIVSIYTAQRPAC